MIRLPDSPATLAFLELLGAEIARQERPLKAQGRAVTRPVDKRG